MGGHDNYEADRKRADEIEQVYPPVRTMVRNHREFVGRAVTWAAGTRGIRYYVGFGSGLPTGDSVHHMARAVIPGAQVAYVDNDAEVTDEADGTILPLSFTFWDADARDRMADAARAIPCKWHKKASDDGDLRACAPAFQRRAPLRRRRHRLLDRGSGTCSRLSNGRLGRRTPLAGETYGFVLGSKILS